MYHARLAALRFSGPGLVEALILSPVPDRHDRVSCLCLLPETGPEGQYPGKQWWQGRRVPGRQISAVNAEVLDALDIPYDVPGDNLILRGFDLSEFLPGDTLRIGDAILQVTPTPHRPCAKFGRRTSAAALEAITEGRWRGILLDVSAPAKVFVGDPAERLILPPSGYNLP